MAIARCATVEQRVVKALVERPSIVLFDEKLCTSKYTEEASGGALLKVEAAVPVVCILNSREYCRVLF
jgi:hypothetical protein